MIENVNDLVVGFLFWLLIAVLSSVLAGCGVSYRFDWYGETGRSDTTISKEFVDTKRPVNERRY